MLNDCDLTKLIKFTICICGIIIVVAYIFSINLLQTSTHNLFLRKNLTISTIRVKHCTVIVRSPLGRLGNVLFEFSTAYGLSLDYFCNLYIGQELINYLKQYFEVNVTNLLTDVELNRTLPAKSIYNHCTYFTNLFYPNTSQTIELSGYWQVYKYFINHTDQIRNQLQFKKPILDRAKNFLTTNISKNVLNLVGIHIRRGDFIGARQVSSDKFIFDAMTYFIKKYYSVNFIIVSDDKSYCRKIFGKRNDTFFTPDSFTPAEDMAVLTLCHHTIITVGTYGWWGAFLLHNRTGEVLTDAKPNYSPLDVDCERSAFFPNWFAFLNKTK